MATLEDFIDEVIAELRKVSGLNFVPDDPPENSGIWPFVPVFHTEGNAKNEPFGTVTYLHRVSIGVLAPQTELTVANQTILPQLEPVIETLYDKLNAPGGFTNADKIGEIDYTYGPTEWGGVPVFGFLMVINEVKIQRNL